VRPQPQTHMKRILILLASLAAASTFATACAVESSTNVLAPASPLNTVSTAAPAPVAPAPGSPLAGTWASADVSLPSPGSCGNFQWQVTNATSTSMSGTFSGTCSGGISIAGSASGELQGTQVPIAVTGTATYANSVSCPFSLSGTGTIVDNNTLTIPYSGTTCLGPVHGTETLHRPQPAAPPAPEPPPPTDPLFGCGGIADHAALDVCIHDHIQPTTVVTAFEVTKRMAWALRGEGAGLLIKNGGDNVVVWQGRSFSASRICYPDGHIFKVLSDVGDGGANGASWQDNGFVDPSLYVPAIDPTLP
jgi:hypothetical protein